MLANKTKLTMFSTQLFVLLRVFRIIFKTSKKYLSCYRTKTARESFGELMIKYKCGKTKVYEAIKNKANGAVVKILERAKEWHLLQVGEICLSPTLINKQRRLN